MPIADALAIFFIEPFILTILSAVVDKEHVGWRRRIAVAAGFVGVLIVVQPSWSVFGPISLVPAAGGAIFAVYALLNRRLSAFDTPLTMQFTAGLSALAIMTLGLVLGSLAGIPDLSPSPVGAREARCSSSWACSAPPGISSSCRRRSSRRRSLIAPMQYVEIVCAAMLGYLVFGDFPISGKWVGIAIIVGSGAYVFWRESRRGAEAGAEQRMLPNLAAGAIMVVVTVVIHGLGLLRMSRHAAKRHQRATGRRRHSPARSSPWSCTVLGLFLLHTVEIWIWALAYLSLGALPDMTSALLLHALLFYARR